MILAGFPVGLEGPYLNPTADVTIAPRSSVTVTSQVFAFADSPLPTV